jgi:hypothetical protein
VFGTADARTFRATLDALPSTIKSNMAADKPEVVTTSVVYQMNCNPNRSTPVIKGRRHYRTWTDTVNQVHLGVSQDHRPETGGSNNFSCITGKNFISNVNTML